MAVAWVDLRIAERDLLQMTLRDLHAYHSRHAQAMEREETLFGVLACAVANFSFSPPSEALVPADFGLGPRKAPRAESAPAAPPSNTSWRKFFDQFGVTEIATGSQNADEL